MQNNKAELCGVFIVGEANPRRAVLGEMFPRSIRHEHELAGLAATHELARSRQPSWRKLHARSVECFGLGQLVCCCCLLARRVAASCAAPVV